MKPVDSQEREGVYFYYGFVRDLFNDKKEYVETEYISVRIEGYDERNSLMCYYSMHDICRHIFDNHIKLVKSIPTIKKEDHLKLFHFYVMEKLKENYDDSNINVKKEFDIACFG